MHDSNLGNGGNSDEQPWTNGGRSPPRAQHGNSADNGAPPPRRSSRSRSPGAPRDGGLVAIYTATLFPFAHFCSRRGDVAGNPGNNLHVSGLSHKVDTRELEQAFAKVGRVSALLGTINNLLTFLVRNRSRRLRSCTTLTHAIRVALGS